MDPQRLKLWAQKWRWYERNSLPWNRARIHLEFARREAFCRWPVHGNVLEMLQEGRLELGPHVLLEPNVWLTAMAPGRIRIGGGTFLNLAVQVAAVELVEIGEHCMFANGCFITDGNHRFDDPDRPVTWQGFTSKGPTRVGDNVWCGANVVITSGVTIGERCVIGANSRRDHRPAAALDRRRRTREGAPDDRVRLVLVEHHRDAQHHRGAEHQQRRDRERAVGRGRRVQAAPARLVGLADPEDGERVEDGDPHPGDERGEDDPPERVEVDRRQHQPSAVSVRPVAIRFTNAAVSAKSRMIETTIGPASCAPNRATIA